VKAYQLNTLRSPDYAPEQRDQAIRATALFTSQLEARKAYSAAGRDNQVVLAELFEIEFQSKLNGKELLALVVSDLPGEQVYMTPADLVYHRESIACSNPTHFRAGDA